MPPTPNAPNGHPPFIERATPIKRSFCDWKPNNEYLFPDKERLEGEIGLQAKEVQPMFQDFQSS